MKIAHCTGFCCLAAGLILGLGACSKRADGSEGQNTETTAVGPEQEVTAEQTEEEEAMAYFKSTETVDENGNRVRETMVYPGYPNLILNPYDLQAAPLRVKGFSGRNDFQSGDLIRAFKDDPSRLVVVP